MWTAWVIWTTTRKQDREMSVMSFLSFLISWVLIYYVCVPLILINGPYLLLHSKGCHASHCWRAHWSSHGVPQQEGRGVSEGHIRGTHVWTCIDLTLLWPVIWCDVMWCIVLYGELCLVPCCTVWLHHATVNRCRWIRSSEATLSAINWLLMDRESRTSDG